MSSKMQEGIQSKSDLLIESLKKFYSKAENIEFITPIVKQKTAISLRLLDWLVTNYSKKYNINYEIMDPVKNKQHQKKNFNMWLEYKNQLRSYSKKNFDPFCRRSRIYFNINDFSTIAVKDDDNSNYSDESGFVTTVGQLNFFRWAITNKVIDYAFDNLRLIESDMLSSADNRKKLGKGVRRREISKTNKSVHKHDIKIVIQFI